MSQTGTPTASPEACLTSRPRAPVPTLVGSRPHNCWRSLWQSVKTSSKPIHAILLTKAARGIARSRHGSNVVEGTPPPNACDMIDRWPICARNRICRRRYAPDAVYRSIGAKSGRAIGKMCGSVLIAADQESAAKNLAESAATSAFLASLNLSHVRTIGPMRGLFLRRSKCRAIKSQ